MDVEMVLIESSQKWSPGSAWWVWPQIQQGRLPHLKNRILVIVAADFPVKSKNLLLSKKAWVELVFNRNSYLSTMTNSFLPRICYKQSYEVALVVPCPEGLNTRDN